MKKQETTALVAGLIVLGIVVFILESQTIALILAAVYGAAILGIFKMLNVKTDNIIPLNIFSIFLMLIFLGFGLMGSPSMADVGIPHISPTASGHVTGVGDVVIHPNYGYNGSDFAESGTFYLLKNGEYNDHYEMLQTYIDEGASGLIGPCGNVAQSATVSSGDVTFSDYEGYDGELLTIGYIYDSTPAAADWPAMLWTNIKIDAVDDDDSDNNHKLSGSVINLWRLGDLDSYNWAGTDITGYKYKATASTPESNKPIEFYARPAAEGDECRDVYYYVETDSTFDSNVDHIEIAGTTYQFGSWIDIADASADWTESKETKQSTSNYLYAVGSVAEQQYVSSVAGTPDRKGQALITVQYDVPSMAANNSMLLYVYGVPEGAGGADMHYSAAANPLFTLNVTTETSLSASDWQT
jgi:hypothetical protein